MVIVINRRIKSLLSVLMLHISKVANATADGGDTESHKVLVWLHIQLKIQRSEHTGCLKEMTSKVTSGKAIENLHAPDSVSCLVSFDRLLWIDGRGLQGCLHRLKWICWRLLSLSFHFGEI